MKRTGNLYHKITSFENLWLASRKARKGKRFKDNVAEFENNIEEELLKLKNELESKTYRPGPYREFTIHDRKPRKISAAPYRDRVVHHALCAVIEPIFDKTFIHDSYACRKEKGTHKAVDRFTVFCRKNTYVLKTDIKKYFPSIDHEILFDKIKKKIKCADTLRLVKLIIDASNKQVEVIDYFPGDTLFSPLERRRGIPIGNLTSQFFANVYLNALDHFAKETLTLRHYIRYVDDITVFGGDKKRLWVAMKNISGFLVNERLKPHPRKTFVLPVDTGIDHLGYRVFPTHRRLRKDTSMRFSTGVTKMKKLVRLGLVTLEKLNASMQSWLGHAGHADTFGLRRKILADINFENQ
jgi:retron-type reverse transcriptase